MENQARDDKSDDEQLVNPGLISEYTALGSKTERVLNTVKPQCLVHLWDHGNLFETCVVRATEG